MSIEAFHPASASVPASSSAEAVGSIVRWAQNLSTAAQAIRLIVDTPFMPTSFWPMPKGVSLRDWPTPHLRYPRETDEEYVGRREIAVASGAIAVVKGDEVGLTPQVALESIYVVRGKPGMYAEAMEALVRSHGHQVLLVDLDDRICRMRSRRRGEDDWQRFEFSLTRATKAGYTRQNTKYDADPQAMLHARCRSITARGTAPEVLKGLRSVEEIEDERRDGDDPPPRTRTVRRGPEHPALVAPTAASVAPAAPALATVGLPPLPGEDEPAAPPSHPSPGPVDERTWSRINARFAEVGVKGDGQAQGRLVVMRSIIGRADLARGGEMTPDEGALVLDNLGGESGMRLVAEVLTADGAPAHLIPRLPDPPVPLDQADEVMPVTDEVVGDYDPTVEDTWRQETDAADRAAQVGD